MASDAPDAAPEHVTVIRERLPLWARILKWLGIAVGALAILVVLALFGVNTGPGRGALARYLSGYTLANGLNIQVGRIDGSIYGAMTLRDVKVRDAKGVFAESPAISVDWRPFAFARNHADIRSATSPLIRVLRLPALKPSTTPTPKNQPLLPDMDIDVNRLAIDRLELAQGVAGAAHIV
jgi:translocation and assembly module TamB